MLYVIAFFALYRQEVYFCIGQYHNSSVYKQTVQDNTPIILSIRVRKRKQPWGGEEKPQGERLKQDMINTKKQQHFFKLEESRVNV